MIGQLKAHVEQEMDRFGLSIVLYVASENGPHHVGIYNHSIQAYEYQEHTRGNRIPAESQLHVSEDEARALYLALSERFDPPEATATSQRLEATQEHLKDARAMLSIVIRSALREPSERWTGDGPIK